MPLALVPLLFALAIRLSVKLTDLHLLGFFSVLASIWMGASLSLMSIADEREVFEHERLSFLRIGPYLLAKIGSLWLMSIVQACIFLGGLWAFSYLEYRGGMLHGALWCAPYLILVGFAAVGLGLVLSAVSGSDKRAANFLLPLVMMIQFLFTVQVAGRGDAPLSVAYGEFNVHRCEQGGGCARRAEVWSPDIDKWICARCEADGHQEAALADSESDEIENRNRPVAFAILPSYFTITRYGDIVLRSFAYSQEDFAQFSGEKYRAASSYHRFGYKVWRREAAESLLVFAVILPIAAAVVLWWQSGSGPVALRRHAARLLENVMTATRRKFDWRARNQLG